MLWKDVWRDVEYVGDDECLNYLGGEVLAESDFCEDGEKEDLCWELFRVAFGPPRLVVDSSFATAAPCRKLWRLLALCVANLSRREFERPSEISSVSSLHTIFCFQAQI